MKNFDSRAIPTTNNFGDRPNAPRDFSADLRPGSVGIRNQTSFYFPFDAWTFDDPHINATPDLILADNWRLSVLGGLNVAGTVTLGGGVTVTGVFTANGDVNLGNAVTDSVTITGRFDSHLIPLTDDTYDLGDAAVEWRNLYLDGTANIDILSVSGAATLSSTLTVAGNVGVGTTDIEAWGSGYQAVEFPDAAIMYGTVATNGYVAILSNAYIDAVGAKRKTADPVGQLYLNNDTLGFQRAATGAADSAITWVTPFSIAAGSLASALTLDSAGVDMAGTLDVVGQLTVTNVSRISTTDSRLQLYETDAGADQKNFEIRHSGAIAQFRFINDAYTLADSWMTVERNVGTYTALEINFMGGYGSTGVTISSAGAIGADGAVTTGGALTLVGSTDTFFDDSAYAYVFRTSGNAGDFSAEAGHLVLQPRTSTGVARDIIFGGGSGTVTEKARIVGASGNFYVDTDTLYVDAANDRVGIGTTTPAVPLTVKGVTAILDETGLPAATSGLGGFRISGYNATGAVIGRAYVGDGTGYSFHFAKRTGSATTDLVTIRDSGRVGVGVDPLGKIHIDQASTTGAIPVLLLDQADVSEEFVRFIGTATSATLTQSIVAEADVTTATRTGFVKVYVQDDGNQITDQAYYMPIYTLA